MSLNIRIKTQDLKIGMYVTLSGSWLSHSFFTNRFLIRNSRQLEKIIGAGFLEVDVDPDRSIVDVARVSEETPTEVAEVIPIVEVKTETKTRTEPAHCFQEADDAIVEISQSQLPSVEKAELIYEQSVEIVKNLFEQPTSAFIGATRKVVGRIVDVILSDPETEENLLRVSQHNYYTYTHSVNVGVYATSLAKHLYTTSAHNLNELAAGFFLHDLGKTEIDPAIICKPGKLTDEEFEIMKKHPYGSYVILRKTQQLSDECRVVALQHHERMDGKGYPMGLKGSEIHEYARICTIADVFDALTSTRSYRDPVSPAEALRIMSEQMSGHFDAEFLRTFMFLFHEAEKRSRAA